MFCSQLYRALGDIGNLVGPFNSRCIVDPKKEAAAKKAAAPAQANQVLLVALILCVTFEQSGETFLSIAKDRHFSCFCCFHWFQQLQCDEKQLNTNVLVLQRITRAAAAAAAGLTDKDKVSNFD